jgi:hypothetical protein
LAAVVILLQGAQRSTNMIGARQDYQRFPTVVRLFISQAFPAMQFESSLRELVQQLAGLVAGHLIEY